MTRLLTMVAVGVIAASSTFAQPMTFTGSFDVLPSMEGSVANANECSDFTGKWKGVCMSSQGAKVEESFAIKQKGCELVEVESSKGKKMFVPVGGAFSMGGSMPGTPASTFGMDMNSSWDKEKKTLTIFVMAGGKKLAVDEAGKGFFVKEDAKLVNGKLAVDIYAMGSNVQKISFCEFDKQP